MNEWISVKDQKLPDPNDFPPDYCFPAISKRYGIGVVLVGSGQSGWIFKGLAKDAYHGLEFVTHWKSLPK